MDIFELVILILKLMWNLVLGTIEAVFWAWYALTKSVATTADAIRLVKVESEGLFCPRGHPVPTTGTFECKACGFVYEGSAFACPNSECPAPTATYCFCPTCRLAVPSPYRLGSH